MHNESRLHEERGCSFMKQPSGEEQMRLAGEKSARRVAEWEKSARSSVIGEGIAEQLNRGSSVDELRGVFQKGLASAENAVLDLRKRELGAERRAFWRECYLKMDGHAEAIAECADAALAEFDKRFGK